MNKILSKIARVGIVTETFKPLTDPELDRLGAELKAVLDRRFAGSLAIRQVDAGSCNACELEIAALGNPFYDVERYGIHFVASPRHADVLMVTGPVSRHMQAALLATWEATPEPKWLVAVGKCAADGGEFGVNYASCGAVSNVLKVDAVIPGCPPTPTDLVRGLLSLISRR
ncbi:NADH-quinone oxidoreductase subunit B family protein [Methylococcus geothermalis]|uniref:Hydrogenase n=1 Tax=Methylococcus geothermalis TaxID=2681310 RepID=A0A858QA70_9GAMM|nr:hydrogenase [Methylococcus geothermalis]QJD30681.1 hydrogenase [Methylococcus geothermalis]